MFIRQTLTSLTCVCLLVSLGYADHLPGRLQARGKPEKMLAGIHLERTRLQDILNMYGRPVTVEGEEYSWENQGLKIRATIYRGKTFKNGEYIAFIAVEGAIPGRESVGRTGAGLKLGDSKARLIQLYGPRFSEIRRKSDGVRQIMVQWRSKEISLIAELNAIGRITRMSLSAPE